MKRFLALALLALAAAFPSAALAQPTTPDPMAISPLRVEPDLNNVNVTTGRTTQAMPVLSVPAAPNLRFDRPQNAALYVNGRVYHDWDGDSHVSRYSVHLGEASDNIECFNNDPCESKGRSGARYLVGQKAYQQAGTGIIYRFNTLHYVSATVNHERTELFYVSSIEHPDGETLTYTYADASLTTDQYGRIFRRPMRITSNRGFYIDFTYQSDDFNNAGWGVVAQARLYASANPSTPLGRLTYSGNTVTDLGGRVYTCTCGVGLGTPVETETRSMQLPGEAAPSSQTAVSTQTAQNAQLGGTVPLQLVGSATNDGVSYAYTYTNPIARSDLSGPAGLGYSYTALTVTGPQGYQQVYNLSLSYPLHLQYVTSSVDSLNRTTSYGYDLYYRVVQVTYPELNSTLVAYDDRGNIISRTQRAKPGSPLADIVETASFPTAGCGDVLCWRPTWTRDALLLQTDYAYNSRGQLTERLDPADAAGVRRRTSITYTLSSGGNSRPTEVRVCADTGASCGTSTVVRTQYEYWGDTNLVTVVRQMDGASGPVLETVNSYDNAGRLLSTNGPLTGANDAAYSRYDVFGRKTWEIGPLGANGVRSARRFTYRDSDDKPTLVENGTVPNESSTTLTVINQTELAYDARRNPIRETVSATGTARTVVQRTFDTRNRLECEAQRMNPVVFASLPASACDLGTQGTPPNDFGPDRITHNVYDNASQLLQVQRAYRITTANSFPATLQQNYATYTYSANGNQTSLTDANGNLATMTWDGHDRQVQWNLPSLTTPGTASTTDYEAYTYDAAGNRLTHRRRDGLTLGFQYDNLNRLLVKTVPERPAPHPQPLTAAQTRDVYYGYDLRNAQLYARFDNASVSAEGVTNQYDGFGRLSTSTINMDGLSRPIGSGYDPGGRRTRVTQPDGLDFTYTYDAAGQLTGLYQGADTSVVLATVTYNPQGLPQTRNERYGSSVTYGFDAVGRLTSQADVLVGGTGNVTFGFGQNPAGQIISRTRSNDAYAWTGAYNVTRNYSANGLNQYTTAGTASFTYDANGNLTSDGTRTFTYDVENRLVGASGGVTLRYDPLGRLYEVSGPTETKRFDWDGDAIVTEYGVSGWITDRYVHGANAGADDPLVWYDSSSRINFLHADHQGSIVAVTNNNYTPNRINAYDEWGIPAMNGTGQNTNAGRFQYTGQIWLPDLGMYHYKARIYSPTLGRFLQVDPVGYQGDVNLYGYVGNNPVNARDPSGLRTYNCNATINPDRQVSVQCEVVEDDSWSTTVNTNVEVQSMDNDGNIHSQEYSQSSTWPNYLNWGILGGSGELGEVSAMVRAHAGVPEMGDLAPVSATNPIVPMLSSPRQTLMDRAQNPELRRTVNELYRPGARIGNGSSMDAHRAGADHAQKLIERRTQLMRIYRDPSLSSGDRRIVRDLLIDIQNALSR
jgi:RHS repeat-associated protein